MSQNWFLFVSWCFLHVCCAKPGYHLADDLPFIYLRVGPFKGTLCIQKPNFVRWCWHHLYDIHSYIESMLHKVDMLFLHVSFQLWIGEYVSKTVRRSKPPIFQVVQYEKRSSAMNRGRWQGLHFQVFFDPLGLQPLLLQKAKVPTKTTCQETVLRNGN